MIYISMYTDSVNYNYFCKINMRIRVKCVERKFARPQLRLIHKYKTRKFKSNHCMSFQVRAFVPRGVFNDFLREAKCCNYSTPFLGTKFCKVCVLRKACINKYNDKSTLVFVTLLIRHKVACLESNFFLYYFCT